jgi:hypothetical protein
MVLLFDYGDEWLFDVALKAKAQAEPRARYPRLLRQVGKAPEQYPQVPGIYRGTLPGRRDVTRSCAEVGRHLGLGRDRSSAAIATRCA